VTDRVTVLPAADRWRPTRAGLIGLWRYWDETFTFHRGRLLLRGPNGSGKSMALELLLPFLLDGDTTPAKLSSATRSRGRLFDRVMTGTDDATRTGFAWVEFRRGEDVFTVGARIRASQATGKADVDLFTTTLAVGRGLHLLDGTRTPLSRKALVDAIGTTGRVHASADEHRAAVREVLFPGFSADRYASVIGALLALRKEKLSQNLDLDKLSAVLSEALPPLDEQDIAAVAEGFERLDRRRAELAALERDSAEVRQLAARQRDYARAVVVGAAAEVRSAETSRDHVTRGERLAREELDAARARADEVAGQRRALEERYAEIAVEIDALKDSSAYRQGASLADLRGHARRSAEHAARMQRTAEGRAAEHATAAREAEEAAAVRQQTADNLELAARDLAAAAEPVGAHAVIDETVGIAEPDDAERLISAWVRARRERAGEVRTALDAHDRAVTQRGFREEQVAAEEAAVEERAAALTAAEAAAARAVEDYRAAVQAWASGCEAVGTPRLAAVLPRPLDDPAAVVSAVSAVTADLRAEEAVARRELGAQRSAAVDERDALLAERARWETGELVDPDGPPWRFDRAGRPGAPLWRLVDLAPDVDAAVVDGVEAALTGAGMLDAWITPDGRVDLSPGQADVTLTARPLPGRTLAALLTPADGAGETHAVAPDVVAAVLSSIPLVDSALGSRRDAEIDAGPHPHQPEVAVGVDGTYRLGSALGRGPVRPAMLLGAVARERHRLARLADLAEAIVDVDRRLADLDRAEAALDRRRAAVDAELAAQPSGEPVGAAARATAAAATRLGEARHRLDAARAERRTAEEAVRAALRDLTTLAARHGLPADRAGLAQVETALARLAEAAGTWARRRRDLRTAERQHERAVERADDAESAAARAAADCDDAERDAAELARRVETLEASVGAEYAEISRRIADLDQERSGNRRRAEALSAESSGLERRVGELAGKVEAAAATRATAEAERDRAHRRLVAAFDAFAPDATIEPPGPLDSGTAVLAAARAVAAEHEQVDTTQQAVERLSERARERVHLAQAALGARVDFDREYPDDGWWVLRTNAGGVRRRVRDLAAALAAQLAEGRAELAAEEERLFEQTLAGSVRRALADRIRQANALVDGINGQLGSIRTAAGGVQVRLRWEVDPEQPAAVKAARVLLLRDPADLSEPERASLQEFVRARVDQARAELEANAPWEARLRETLDYRSWHRFSLQLAHRDWEGFQTATPRRLQKLSTGERSITLHLPMIASVAAHYADDEGRPSGCPRLILLDELFAGVDTANRAQLFGTFTTWDLDAVFTSDHEWCQYSTLDGIAIHYLHPPTGDEPVTSTRFTWDGRRKQIDPAAA